MKQYEVKCLSLVDLQCVCNIDLGYNYDAHACSFSSKTTLDPPDLEIELMVQ